MGMGKRRAFEEQRPRAVQLRQCGDHMGDLTVFDRIDSDQRRYFRSKVIRLRSEPRCKTTMAFVDAPRGELFNSVCSCNVEEPFAILVGGRSAHLTVYQGREQPNQRRTVTIIASHVASDAGGVHLY